MNKKFTFGFLAITALTIGWELFAVFDGNDETWPWTALIATYIPFEIGFPLISAFSVWLIIHFWKAYKKK